MQSSYTAEYELSAWHYILTVQIRQPRSRGLMIRTAAEPRDSTAGPRTAKPRDSIAESRDSIAKPRDSTADPRDSTEEARVSTAENRDSTAEVRECLAVRSPAWRLLVPYIPLYVYYCNRPLAPILRQRWCSLHCRAKDCRAQGQHCRVQG
jgi:hypothetical protein